LLVFDQWRDRWQGCYAFAKYSIDQLEENIADEANRGRHFERDRLNDAGDERETKQKYTDYVSRRTYL